MILGLSAYREILLALMVWREARGESYDAQVAVAWTVVNRVNLHGWMGSDTIEVITKKEQYSSVSHPGDPQLTLFPQAMDQVFYNILGIVNGVLGGYIPDPTDGATHYFDSSIPAPEWTLPAGLKKSIGRLHFYRVP